MSLQRPPFVNVDYTGQLLAQLKQATLEILPPGQADEEAARKLVTMLWKADLEFQYRVANYNMYVPIVTIILVPRQSQTPDLPENIRVALTATEEAKCQLLKEQFKVTTASKPVNDAFQSKAETLNWYFAQIVAGRLDIYWNITKEFAEDNMDAIPKSLAIGFASTLLSIAGMALNTYNINDPLARVLVSCPAFALTAVTLELSAPLGIGVIAVISMAENFADCLQNLSHLVNQINDKLSEESKMKQLAKVANRNRPGDYYERSDGRIDVFSSNGELTNRITVNPVGPDRETGDHSNGEKQYESSQYTQVGSNGKTEYCMSFHEWTNDGNYDSRGVVCTSQVNSGDGEETITPDHSLD